MNNVLNAGLKLVIAVASVVAIIIGIGRWSSSVETKQEMMTEKIVELAKVVKEMTDAQQTRSESLARATQAIDGLSERLKDNKHATEAAQRATERQTKTLDGTRTSIDSLAWRVHVLEDEIRKQGDRRR